jgi:riboflavin kinase / FMN adenylyltransferase
MIVVRRTDDPALLRPSIVTLGVFDGLHLGHQAIVRKVVERAAATGAAATAVTFDPHPRAVLYPESAPLLLQTFEQRLEGLRFLGIDQVVALEFDRALAAVPAEEFVRRFLLDELGGREIYLGKGFAFGYKRGGTIDLLRRLGEQHGFEADEVAEVRLHSNRISSTAIRRMLADGRVNIARKMLGRPYGVEGSVLEGRHLGGPALSFPTANIVPHNRVLPDNGVYITATLFENEWHRGVTNVGRRPTVGEENHITVETHLLDFDRQIYGERIRVRFLRRLRGEKRFASLDDLKAQIARDVMRGRRYFDCPVVRRNLSFV